MMNQGRTHIAACLLAALPVAVVLAVLPFLGEPGLGDPKTAEAAGLWVGFLGTLHPLFLHLPIGAFLLVMLLEGLGLVTRGRYEPATLIPLLFTLGTGLLALVFGYCLYLTGSYAGELIEQHKSGAFIFCWMLLATTLLKVAHRQNPVRFSRLHFAYLVSLGATGAVMTIAGHLGGEITHGDPLDKLPPKILAERRKAAEELLKDPVVYQHVIQPILQERCVYCHGPEKQEGDYRMDSYPALLAAGLEGTGVVPGNLEESDMVVRLHLPAQDRHHMPPPDKPQPTREEIALIEWWISQGAPEAKRKSEMEVFQEIEEALASLVSPAERKALEEERKRQEEEYRERIRTEKNRIRPDWMAFEETYPGALGFLNADTMDLRLSAISYPEAFREPAAFERLTPLQAFLVDADFTLAGLDDRAAEPIAQWTSLRRLNVSQTEVSDAFVERIAGLPGLEILNLYGTRITPASIPHLEKMSSLRALFVGGTGVEAGPTGEIRERLAANRGVEVLVIGADSLPNLELLTPEGMLLHRVKGNPDVYGASIESAASVSFSSVDARYHPSGGDNLFTDPAGGEMDFTFHTRNETRPWVQLQFDAPHRISAFLLANRTSLPQRAEGLELERLRPDGTWERLWEAGLPQGRWAADLSGNEADQRVSTAFRFIINKDHASILHLGSLALWGEKVEDAGPFAEAASGVTSAPVAAGPVSEGKTRWRPDALGGLTLWLDADDPGSYTVAGGRMAQWDDKSTNRFHAFALADEEQPRVGTLKVNGRHAVEFGDSRLANRLPEAGNWQDLYVVADWNGGATFENYNGLFTGFDGGIGVIGNTQDSGTGLWLHEKWWTSLFVNGHPDNGEDVMERFSRPFLVSCSADKPIDISGFSIGNDRSIGIGQAQRRDWEGTVCEVIAFARKLSDAERHQVEGYLAHKWGLVELLPPDHPHRLKAPGEP